MIEFDRRDDLDVLGYEGMSIPPTFFAENYSAAFKNVEALEMTNSKPLLLARYWDEKFERLQEIAPDAIGSGYVFEEGFGTKLLNPAPYINRTIFDYLPMPGAADPFLMNTIASKLGAPHDTTVPDVYESRANKIYKFIQDNQDILPDDLKTLTPENVAADIDQIRRDAREEFEDVSSRSVGAGGFTGRLAGGAVASFKDPVIQGTSIVGGLYGTGNSLLRLALIEAALGGGASAVTQPKIKEWYDELGYDYTYKDFLRNVSIDAIASAGLGVGINLTARSVSKGWNAFKTTDNANPESQALANAADDAVDLEQSNPLENPDTPGSQVEHEQRLTEATHSLQSGKAPDLTNEPVNNVQYAKPNKELQKSYDAENVNNAKFDKVSNQIDELENQRSALNDALQDLEINESKKLATKQKKQRKKIEIETKKLKTKLEKYGEENQRILKQREILLKAQEEEIIDGVENLDGVVFKIEANRVIADPKRFQFKSETDEFGVSAKLKDQIEWNPALSGQVMFWEDLDGKIFIADGHQRLGLAKRIMANDPSQKISLYGTLLREADGYTAEHAKVNAAAKNISEATDNEQLVIDAAKILRVHADLDEAGIKLPPRSSVVVQARAISTLNDEAFGAVINGIVPGNYASVVGRLISPDQPDLQNAAIAVLSKSQPKNMTEAEFITREVIESGVTKETQETLFGDEMFVSSLVLERARIIDETQKLLKADKNAFRNLTQNAERIEAEGNKLVKTQNERLANENAQAIALLQTLSTRKGQLSDELTETARRAKETGNFKVAARDYAEAVRRGIERGDFDRATTSDLGRAIDDPPEGGIGKSEEQLFDDFDEPTGPGVERQTEQMIQDTFRDLEEIVGEEIPGETNAKVIEKSFKDRQPVETVDDIYKIAPESQDFIVNIGKGIEKDLGVELKNTGLKKIETAKSKVGRKGYGGAKELTDISRIGFIVSKQEQSDEIVKRFGQEVEVLDEGWSTTPAGYFDRKLLVRTPNGLISEVQIWSPKLFDAKFNKGGEQLYTQYREVEKTNPKKANELAQKQRSLYAEAISQEDSSFLKVSGIGKLPKFRSNSDINAFSSGITRPVLKTSGPSTAVQEPPGVSIARASVTENEIAGRPSQSTSIRSDISEPPTRDIIDPVSEVKAEEEGFNIDFNQEDLDLEIPFSFDPEGKAVGKTLRDIKKDIDADDALIRRLEVCGL